MSRSSPPHARSLPHAVTSPCAVPALLALALCGTARATSAQPAALAHAPGAASTTSVAADGARDARATAQPAAPSAAQAAAQPVALPPRLGAPARAAIERLADSVRAAGAPAGPLYAKAAEGVLKGADDARIVVAVRRLARDLTEARATLGTQAPDGDVIAAASALHAGVPASTLQRLRAARGGRGGLALPFTVLADLATRGVPPDVAAASLDTLLAHGAAESELSAFRAGVERDLLAGRDPQAALGARTQNAIERIEGRERTGVPRPDAAPVPRP